MVVHYKKLPGYQAKDKALQGWAEYLISARSVIAAMNRSDHVAVIDSHPLLGLWINRGWIKAKQIISPSTLFAWSLSPSIPLELRLYNYGERYVPELGLPANVALSSPHLDKSILYQPLGKDAFWLGNNPQLPRPGGYSIWRRRDLPGAVKRLGKRSYVIGPHDGADGLGIAVMSSLLDVVNPKKILCHMRRGLNVMEKVPIAVDGTGAEISYSIQYETSDGMTTLLGATRQLLKGNEWYGNILLDPAEARDVLDIGHYFIDALPQENRLSGGVDIVLTTDGRKLVIDPNVNRDTGAHQVWHAKNNFGAGAAAGRMFVPRQTIETWLDCGGWQHLYDPTRKFGIIPTLWSLDHRRGFVIILGRDQQDIDHYLSMF